ncbi:gamma carbonic anhydrase family protein [Candidatus Puniceispirillum sp.]|jgi:gamma-carbonic anhydrase|uniref:gamma carbonic anhydrase family protein n=1 Tax=Candidatus Puniceispirillum sp. TaxID=2026719 RepID=UPI002FCE39D2
MTDESHNMLGTKRQPYIAPFLGLAPEIDASAFVAATAAIIGAVRIGKNSSIWHQVTVRGDNNYITIGEGTNIQDNSCVHIDSIKYPTIIGNFATIGHSAIIHACTIGDYGFVGMGGIVMDGATIEDAGMLAAGGMLTAGKTIPAGELWADRPAKKMRDLTPKELTFNQRSAHHYIEVARAHRLGNDGAPFDNMHFRPLPPLTKETE